MNRLQMVMYLSWGFWLAYSYVHLFSKREKPGGKALFFLCLLPPIPVLMLKADMMTIFTSVILLIILLAMFAKSSTPAKSNGTGSSSNADSSPGDGILTPDGGDHSPHGGAPSPLGGAPSPHGG
ncbi:MAG: hypothetical protein GY765_16355, partial [bacterium]|nr:hypothetical protein [bacterium]